jgi:hypothetical protein
MRRTDDGSAASTRPEADGSAEWDRWYGRQHDGLTLAQVIDESPLDKMRRAFLAGWLARDAVERRKAADELTALTEDLGLYDDGREP